VGESRKLSAQSIVPCLWFDGRADEAAAFYTAIFADSKIVSRSRMAVQVELDGQRLIALNGRPSLEFNEAISLMVGCETQEEVDHYWEKLSEGGEEGRCGWLKDRFGVSWQIVPDVLPELIGDLDPARSERAMQAMLGMKKLDIAELRRAHAGEPSLDRP
jgi:predicted 3-demethylubiquinone-9 3-methyltransferase (glyoxalase superfamily)